MDQRLSKFKIVFPNGWIDISNENPDGPPTFIKETIKEPGVLQISTADYIGGSKPIVEYNDLTELSRAVGLRNEFGEIITKESGECKFGMYGYVQFSRADFPFITVWHLTNGKDFLFSTFICSVIPMENEIEEVKEILTSTKRKRPLF